jgi:hypothetical protein
VRFAVLLAARGLSYDHPLNLAACSSQRRNEHGVAVADRAGKTTAMEEIA